MCLQDWARCGKHELLKVCIEVSTRSEGIAFVETLPLGFVTAAAEKDTSERRHARSSTRPVASLLFCWLKGTLSCNHGSSVRWIHCMKIALAQNVINDVWFVLILGDALKSCVTLQ